MSDGTINQTFRLSDLCGKYIVLFFWPEDFTFVWPTEIIAHEHRFGEFKKRNGQVVGVSIDTKHVHAAWRNTPVKRGGVSPVRLPMVADLRHTIAQAYGIEHPNDGVVLRASFPIDKDGIVQHQVVNNISLGRNVNEMVRMVDALQFHEEHGEACPAGWQKAQVGIKESADSVARYLSEHSEKL